jgi:mannose-1-phosphate guanylyltransferase
MSIMEDSIQPVILCGGFGTRLWPLSTPNIPKQFISLGTKGTFLDQTLQRISAINICKESLLIMHEDHKVVEKTDNINKDNIIYEKYSNDTAVAVARVVDHLNSSETNDETLLLFLPADHYIGNTNNFINDILEGSQHIDNDNIVLFGLNPTNVETKYGYILSTENKLLFREKPDYDTAKKLIDQGAMWNSGIFLTKLKTLNKLFSNCKYDIQDWIINERSGKAPSFDVAILQEHDKLYCQPCDNWNWDDIGTWNSFLQLPDIKQELLCNKISQCLDCNNVSILNRTEMPVLAIGCDNISIINTPSGLLILSNKKENCDSHNNILKNFSTKLYQ